MRAVVVVCRNRGRSIPVTIVVVVILAMIIGVVVILHGVVVTIVVVVVVTFAIGSRDRHGIVVRRSSNSRSSSSFLGSVESRKRSLLKLSGNRVHVVEMHMEEIALRRNGLLLFFLTDNLTSALIKDVSDDGAHSDVTEGATDGRDEAEVGLEGGFVC